MEVKFDIDATESELTVPGTPSALHLQSLFDRDIEESAHVWMRDFGPHLTPTYAWLENAWQTDVECSGLGYGYLSLLYYAQCVRDYVASWDSLHEDPCATCDELVVK